MRFLIGVLLFCHALSAAAESLAKNLAGVRKYRIGDWRVVAGIQREKITVLVVKVVHRVHQELINL